MPRKLRVNKNSPLWLITLVLFIALAQHYGWLKAAQNTVTPVPAGQYRVLQVIDGDTIEVDMDGKTEKIRMIGVDTPETHDPRKAVQCFGKAASDFTAGLVSGQTVRLEADPLSSNRDRYNRLLRYVYTPDNRLVAAEVIKQGFGFAYTSFPFAKSDEFKAYERQAEQEGRGLWGSCEVKGTSTTRSTNDVE